MNIFELKQKPLWQMTGDDLLSLMRHEWEEETAAEESLAAKQVMWTKVVDEAYCNGMTIRVLYLLL